ncbi:MAG: serine hydrolase domain-containing protein [Gemmatimonadales bacterium]
MARPFRWILALALLTGVVPHLVAAQAERPAVRRARELVGLINAGTPAGIRSYVDSAFGGQFRTFPIGAHLNFLLGQRTQSQALDWVGPTDTAGDAATVVLTRRLTGDRFGLFVRVEPAAPHRVVSLGARPAPPGSQPAARVASDADLAAQLERYVGRLAGADAFSGAVLLAKNGKVIYSKAYGIANKDFEVPNRLDTRFNLGSMNKMFTAVAIAQLAEKGKLSFDDPLARFLPDFPNPEAAKKVRIKHLLSHTAGLGSYFNDEFMKSSRELYRTVDDMMKLAKGDSLAFEPGSRWSYSNTGILVLGKVIEVASGQDYFSYVRDHIYKPAGMTRSDSYDLDYVNTNLAVGYDREYQDDGTVRFKNNVFQHVIRGGPAGGGYSTVEDLQRFGEALMAGKLAGKASVDQLISAKPELRSPSYGYGFSVDPNGIVGHSGGFPGISSNLDIFTRSGYLAVVQSNYGGASAPVSQKIRALVEARVGKPVP